MDPKSSCVCLDKTKAEIILKYTENKVMVKKAADIGGTKPEARDATKGQQPPSPGVKAASPQLGASTAAKPGFRCQLQGDGVLPCCSGHRVWSLLTLAIEN